MQTTPGVANPTWQQFSTSDTGVFMLQNCSEQIKNSPADLVFFRWYDDATDPSVSAPNEYTGKYLLPGQTVSRGSETGHLWARTRSGEIPVAITE